MEVIDPPHAGQTCADLSSIGRTGSPSFEGVIVCHAQPRQKRTHFLEAHNELDVKTVNGAVRHRAKCCFLRILHDRRAMMLLYLPKPCRTIIERPCGERKCNYIRRLVLLSLKTNSVQGSPRSSLHLSGNYPGVELMGVSDSGLCRVVVTIDPS